MEKEFNFKNIKKIGLGIVAFEGTEHLYNIISEIKDFIGYVVVGLQDISYHGDPIDPIDKEEVLRLKNEDHLVDTILNIKLNAKIAPREQETAKRNALIEDCQKNGCSHVLIIDSDEFYSKNAFERAVKEIDENDYELTYCEYINYYHDYMHYMVYPFPQGMYVPFVSKAKYRFVFNTNSFPHPSDPTRRYFTGPRPNPGEEIFHIFKWNELKMHHLSWIRANIVKKVESWSSKKCFDNFEDLIDKAIFGYERFDQEKEGIQKTNILFNTPDSKIEIDKFPKQYIFPKTDISKRLKQIPKKQNILFLQMSCNIPFFIEEEKLARETWAKDIVDEKVPNMQFWTYRESKAVKKTTVIKKKHLILVPFEGNSEINETATKSYEAFKALSKIGFDFDWLVRTNCSTYFNVPLLEYYLGTRQSDLKIYGSEIAAIWWSGQKMYMKGNCMIWSKRNFNILMALIKENYDSVLKMQRDKAYCDDVIFGNLFNARYEILGIDHTCMWKAFGMKNLWDGEIDDRDLNDSLLDEICIQVKSYYEDNRDSYGFGRDLPIEKSKMEAIHQYITNQYISNNLSDDYKAEAVEMLEGRTSSECLCILDKINDWNHRSANECGYRWMKEHDMKSFNETIDMMMQFNVPFVDEKSKK